MRSFVIGGPYYQSRLDVRAAMSVSTILLQARSYGWSTHGWIAEDGLLDLSRNKLMDKAIGLGVDWLISVDADISFMNPEAIFASLAVENDPKIALIGWPAKCGNDRWNVVDKDMKVFQSRPNSRCDVSRIGTGAIAFRLGWYVKNWPKDAPYFQTITVRGDNGVFHAVGEDYGHCNAVRSLGGRVVCDPSPRVIHHTARPGSPGAKHDSVID